MRVFLRVELALVAFAKYKQVLFVADEFARTLRQRTGQKEKERSKWTVDEAIDDMQLLVPLDAGIAIHW